MIVVCEPEDSYKWYDKMWSYSVELFRSLDIPVRTLECCSGDLADLKAKSLDVEHGVQDSKNTLKFVAVLTLQMPKQDV